MGTSSANPDHLDVYVRAAQSLNDTLRRRSGSLDELYKTVMPRLGWGAFDASATLDDLARYIRSNHSADQWVAAVSGAFRKADSGGDTATVADPFILGEGVVDMAEGGTEVVRYGGEAVARGSGWLWKHTFGR